MRGCAEKCRYYRVLVVMVREINVEDIQKLAASGVIELV
jgi:hypothetical protein